MMMRRKVMLEELLAKMVWQPSFSGWNIQGSHSDHLVFLPSYYGGTGCWSRASKPSTTDF